MVSPEVINEINEKADIVEIVSKYVKLEKKGSSYVGVCPFHDDSSPSMSVKQERHCFNCFSCGAKGNAVGFIQRYKNVSFIEALKEVADTVNIKIDTGDVDDRYLKLNNIFNINQQASELFKLYLTNSTAGEDAIKYLNNRQLSKDVIDRFNIGLAPNDDLLFKSLESKYLPIDLVQAGLVKEANNHFFDIFKDRIMFPITNLQGHIVAFSGRIYNKEKSPTNPKYVNTVDTIAFKKSELLYNYYESMADIKQHDLVYLFEGYMDVIASYRCGIYNSVASMGTSLTNGQIKAIGKLTKNVVVCYDGDNAGVNATKKAIIAFAAQNVQVKVVTFEDNLDPDEYINKYGSEKLFEKLSNPISGIEFIYGIEKRNLYVEDPNSVENFKNNLFNFIKQLKSDILNEFVFKKMAKDLNISIVAIRKDFLNVNSIPSYEDTYHEGFIEGYNQGIEATKQTHGFNYEQTSNDKLSMKKFYKAEEGLIKLAYNDKENSIKIDSLLNGKFAKQEYGDILSYIFLYYRNNDVMDTEILRSLINDEVLMGILLNVIESDYTPQVTSLNELVKIVQSSSDSRYINNIYKEGRTLTAKDLELASQLKRKNIRKREK